MTTLRKGTTAFVFIVSFLAVFMVFSHSGLSPSLDFIERAEREAYESDYSNRNSKVFLRVKAAQPSHSFVDRTPFLFLLVPTAFYFLLAAPWVHFRPFYSLFMKRSLLLPIKFMSKFVV